MGDGDKRKKQIQITNLYIVPFTYFGEDGRRNIAALRR